MDKVTTKIHHQTYEMIYKFIFKYNYYQFRLKPQKKFRNFNCKYIQLIVSSYFWSKKKLLKFQFQPEMFPQQ